MLAIIGGSGFYYLGSNLDREDVITPYGDASLYHVRMGRRELLFLPRHGQNHELPPHKINYRANIYALAKSGATAAFATYACGIISKYKTGDLVVLKDFIGLNTPITFFDDFSAGIRHTDFTEPFDRELVEEVKGCASAVKVKLQDGGIAATTVGPRYETKAEIIALKRMGANLVGMTPAYETTLLKEMEIPFAAIAIGTNYACGISKKKITHAAVMTAMTSAKVKVNGIITELAKNVE
jgi:5'-methylthioadenosine phosphorylase